MKADVFAKNLRVLRKHHSILAKALEMDIPPLGEYVVEPARNGSPTLAMKTADGKLIQVHSKYDPEKESADQIRLDTFRNPRILLIFGLGLGYHIRTALEVLQSKNHFIVVIERDLHALKTALAHVDFTDLLESEKIRWAIGIPENEGFSVLTDLIKSASISFQLFLKALDVYEHPALAKISGEYNKAMLRSFREAAHVVIFNYGNCPHDSLIGVENIMRNLATIMKNPGIRDLYGSFKGVPGVVIATGPSLDKNVRDLIGMEDKCVMISADSALEILLRHGIHPHMVTSLERIEKVAAFFEKIPAEELKNTWLAGTPVIMPSVYQAYRGSTIIVYRNFAHFEWLQMQKGTLDIGPSCTNMAFKILEALGCNPIILIGQDCAFEDVKKTHADGVNEVSNLNLRPEQLYPIKGNYSETVPTSMIFDMFRKAFVNDVARFQGTCINSTAGGAFIEGTVLMPLAEALAKYGSQNVQAVERIRQGLKVPTPSEIKQIWRRFRQVMLETRTEVKNVIDFCDKGEQKVIDFDKELTDGGFTDLDDFLKRFPESRLNAVFNELSQDRGKVITFGKYFNLYLMHIVQMIVVSSEMDFNELPSLSDDHKRCKLQAIRMMKNWFPTIGSVVKIAFQLLEEAFATLEAEFNPDKK